MSQVTFEAKLVVNGDMSSSITSSVAILDYVSHVAIQAKWTGSPSGQIKLQSSLDGSTWTDVANSTVTVSGADNCMWNLSGIGFTKCQVVYTRVSGSGTLNITSTGKI